MEDCTEIRQCYNKYNKDHLATIEDSLKAREENKKQWLMCGFNGFGQIKFQNKHKLLKFEETEMPFNVKKADDLVACSWNCLAIANGCTVYLRGFTSNGPNNFQFKRTKVPIKYLDICDKFCLLLTENGKVYKLSLGSEDDLAEIKFQQSVKPVTAQKRNIFGNKKETNLEIAHVACGNSITIAISTSNSVFSGTVQIYTFPNHHRTKQLKCGFEHVLLLTSNGDIYSWGNGLRGQLGMENLRLEETPKLIDALAGIKITYIAAGGWHSAAISAFGDIYTWGFNSNGQLGLRLYRSVSEPLKEPSVYHLPQLIEVSPSQFCTDSNNIADSCSPIKIVAGARHTILQMNCGAIYACGWNAYGQLGLNKSQNYCDNFEFVLKIEDRNIPEIVCGNWCTIIKK